MIKPPGLYQGHRFVLPKQPKGYLCSKPRPSIFLPKPPKRTLMPPPRLGRVLPFCAAQKARSRQFSSLKSTGAPGSCRPDSHTRSVSWLLLTPLQKSLTSWGFCGTRLDFPKSYQGLPFPLTSTASLEKGFYTTRGAAYLCHKQWKGKPWSVGRSVFRSPANSG